MQPQAKGCWQSLKAGRVKEGFCTLEPLGRAQPCQRLDFSLMNADLGLLPSKTVKEQMYVLLIHQVYGNLLQWP